MLQDDILRVSMQLSVPVQDVMELDIPSFGSVCDSLGRIEAGKQADLALAFAAGQSGEDGLGDFLKIKNWEQGFETDAPVVSGREMAAKFGGGI